ncbi:MAG: thermonuclease family protein [Cyanobacteria bacterium J06648_1]
MATPEVSFQFSRTTRPAKERKFLRVSDGDTPVVEQSIRMVSCDTPEKSNYAGKPDKAQPKLDLCRDRLENGFYDDIPKPLRDYFIDKLTPDAAQRHIDAANDATDILKSLVEERLTKPNGSKRRMATIPTGELIDRYGRLLAYTAPWYGGSRNNDPLPPKGDPRRDTFNFNMIENGWAAFFPIYPSLPSNQDFNRAILAAEKAWSEKRGAWASYGENLLLAYEYRVCIKLAKEETASEGIRKAFQRVCVDLRSQKIVGKYGFYDVPPCYRMWVWLNDIEEAKENLNLLEE